MRQIAMEFIGEVANPQRAAAMISFGCTTRFYTDTAYLFMLGVGAPGQTVLVGLSGVDILTFAQALGGLTNTPPVVPPVLQFTELSPLNGQPAGTVEITMNPSVENGRQAFSFSFSLNGAAPVSFRIFGSDIWDAYQALLLIHNNWV